MEKNQWVLTKVSCAANAANESKIWWTANLARVSWHRWVKCEVEKFFDLVSSVGCSSSGIKATTRQELRRIWEPQKRRKFAFPSIFSPLGGDLGARARERECVVCVCVSKRERGWGRRRQSKCVWKRDILRVCREMKHKVSVRVCEC